MKMKFFVKIFRLGFVLFPLLSLCSVSAFTQQGMTLEQALNTAETNSPSMKRTRLSLIRSQENLNAQKASLKSQFSLTLNPLGYTQSREFNNLISDYNTFKVTESFGSFSVVQPILISDARISLTNKFGYKDSYSEYSGTTNKGFNNNLSISLDQPLFTYNRTKLTLKELELALENSQLTYAIQLLALERQVAQAFYYVYQQQQSLDISLQAYQNMQKSYEVSRNKVDAGISAREEMFQAELNLATTKSDYENALVSLENARDDFKLMVGISLYEDIIVIPNIAVDTISVNISFAIDQGLANRMELRQHEINIENTQFDLIRTKSMNEFRGSLGLSLGLFGDNEKLDDIYANPTDNETVASEKCTETSLTYRIRL